MEFAVYFKQGLDHNRMDLMEKLAGAFCQIVFDEVQLDFASFTEAFGCILKMLSIGNNFLNLKSFSKIAVDNFLLKPLPVVRAELSNLSIFTNPLELFLFSVKWVQIARERLVRLFPDSSKCFEKNILIEIVEPELCEYFKSYFKKDEEPHNLQSASSSSASSIHSLLPVAYSNQRDSRNFFTDPIAHANQQKIRDLFLNLIRHFSTNQLDTSQPNFKRNFGSRVTDLMGKLSRENFSWLADLYLQEYEQTADVRLDRLEERLAARRAPSTSTSINSSNSKTFTLDQMFFLFLQFADSFKLTRSVEKKVINLMMVLLDQANNIQKRSSWPECIRKLRSIIKVLLQ